MGERGRGKAVRKGENVWERGRKTQKDIRDKRKMRNKRERKVKSRLAGICFLTLFTIILRNYFTFDGNGVFSSLASEFSHLSLPPADA